MHIERIIKDLIPAFMDDHQLDTVVEINQGLCDDFAAAIQERLPQVLVIGVEEFMKGDDGDPAGADGFDWSLLSSWGISPPEGLTRSQVDQLGLGWHVWVTHQGRHYDAECPEGVESFFDLPCLRRQIAEATSDWPTCYATYTAPVADGEWVEYGFQFEATPRSPDPVFRLVLGRAKNLDDTVTRLDATLAEHTWLATGLLMGQSPVKARLLIKGPTCPSDGEDLYWCNQQGWVDRGSAERFDVDHALRGLYLHEATALELAPHDAG